MQSLCVMLREAKKRARFFATLSMTELLGTRMTELLGTSLTELLGTSLTELLGTS
jgi:hypothetical protein